MSQENMVRICWRKVVRFLDEKLPESVGHATSVVGVLGEDLGAATFKHCVETNGFGQVKVHDGPVKGVDLKGPWLDPHARGDMPANHELLGRITAHPDVFGGKPIIRDLRISVELVLSLLTRGVSPEASQDDYPGVELHDIRACTAYAQAVIAGDTLAAVSVAES